MLLVANDIYKSFRNGLRNKRAVLKGTSFEIDEQEIFCIMGPSGGGKSTLLKILAAILHSDKGSLLFNNIPIKYKASQYIRQISFIFQDYKLIPHLNAFENVALALRLRGINGWKEKAHQSLEYVGVSHLAKIYPSQMSGGESQRVGIARAISIEPSLIFADEPTGNLDQKTGQDILNVFHRIKEEFKTSFVIVSHDPFVKKTADKIAYMQDGILIDKDPYDE